MKRNVLLIVVLVSICLLPAIWCQHNSQVQSGEENVHVKPLLFFRFDAEEAYQAVQNGQLPTVQPISEAEFDQAQDQPDIEINHIWTDAMFLKLQESVLKQMEITRPMKINMANYTLDCDNLDGGSFVTKYISSSFWLDKDGFHRYNLDIQFDLSDEIILVHLKEFYPVYKDDTDVLHFDRMKYDYLDMVKIADENGGKEVREEYANDCRIKVYSSRSTDYAWQIYIGGKEYRIDPLFGKVIPESLYFLNYFQAIKWLLW